MVVYVPQLAENYRIQSGEGLCILLILAWIIGDVCNLIGAVLGGLVSSVIWLGLYVRFPVRSDRSVMIISTSSYALISFSWAKRIIIDGNALIRLQSL
jgi:hypothetical protein